MAMGTVSEMTSTQTDVVDRARRHVNAGEYAAAVAVLSPHLRSYPDDVDALNALGLATFQMGRFDDALAAYREMWTIVPTDVRALYGAGMALQKLGRLDDAEAWFAATLTVDPEFDRAASRLAELPGLRAAASPGAANAPGQPHGRRPLTDFIVPEDEEELETYRRTSRAKARIDLMNQYWYGIPWPVRVLQIVVIVVIAAGVLGVLGR
jgi:tetratricopeptide (TPR) repeat protein